MSTAAYIKIIETFFGQSPYMGLTADSGDSSPPGWGHDSPVFGQMIHEAQPELVVEVGSWLGASAIHMANLMSQYGIDGAVVCVDTWLGSPIHWQTEEYRRQLDPINGYPRLYHAFLANVLAAGHAETILPLPQPTDNAARVLAQLQLQPQLIYIDGDHEAMSVYNDLTNYWPLLAPGGIMFGDDFLREWPGVVRAVQLFAERQGKVPEIIGAKWILRKD